MSHYVWVSIMGFYLMGCHDMYQYLFFSFLAYCIPISFQLKCTIQKIILPMERKSFFMQIQGISQGMIFEKIELLIAIYKTL